MRPILLSYVSVNHSAPSGPLVICEGPPLGAGTENSVTSPTVVMRPIALGSVNHNAPSGPTVIPAGPPPLFGEGTGYSVIAPAVVIRPTFWPSIPYTTAPHPAPP